jgi:hypothetical protein
MAQLHVEPDEGTMLRPEAVRLHRPPLLSTQGTVAKSQAGKDDF